MPRSSHDPPIAALRGSCALPIPEVGYNADIREALLRSSLHARLKARPLRREAGECKRQVWRARRARRPTDRKSVVEGKGVSVGVDLGGSRNIQTKTQETI